MSSQAQALIMETSSSQPLRTKLEASKERLASAFYHLEQAIEQRVKNSAPLPAADHTNETITKTEELTENLQQLTSDYCNLKEVSTDVYNQLNTSIHALEAFLKNKHTSNA